MLTNPEATPLEQAPPVRRDWLASLQIWILLAGILCLGAHFRFLNLHGWDGDAFLHPDERFIVYTVYRLQVPRSLGDYFRSDCAVDGAVRNPSGTTDLAGRPLPPEQYEPSIDSGCNTLNPRNFGWSRFFVYGTLPTSLTRLVAEVRQQVLVPNSTATISPTTLRDVGRSLSAFFDLLSVFVVFLIARRLYGAYAGLLAAALYSMAVLPIQLAHFFTVDATTGFFVLLSVYWAVRAAQGGGIGSFSALGLSIGGAMACRITMATLGLLAILAVAHQLWLHPERDQKLGDRFLTLKLGGLLVLSGILTVLTFRVLAPDSFVGTSFFDVRPEPRFIQSITSVNGYVTGQIDAPFSQQWANRTPFLFPLQNMIIWGMGVPFGVAAWLAWAAAGWEMIRRRRFAHLLPVAWIGFYFAWQGGQFGMTMRYYALLYGLFAVLAAWGLLRLWVGFRNNAYLSGSANTPFWAILRRVPLVIVLAGTVVWAFAFSSIYRTPHSRIAASSWIYANIPPGAAITSEEWDDTLPVAVEPHIPNQYVFIKMRPYQEDDPVKYTGYIAANGTYVPGLFDHLDQADYIILTSNRVYDSATRLPMRYPALTRYYYHLFDGSLGFELAADIHSYPRIFGFEFPDQGAEEAFSVYDHPKILIFKKTSTYSRARAEQLITGDVAFGEVYKLPTVRIRQLPTALRLTEDQWPAYRAAGTWSQLFNPEGLTNRAPWLFWLLMLEVLSLACFMLLFRVLRGLPDCGFALAKTLGLLLAAYGAWLLGSFRIMSFSPASAWLSAGLLIIAGGVAGWFSRTELIAFLRQKRTALLSAQGLFLLAFFGFLLVRALNPDLWHPARGGEKPMDLAFLTAVLKSAAFPAYDPWFAGGYINYYYFGFVIVGTLVHLTGVVPATAYNLAVPTMFALTALGAWGVAYNLVGTRTKNKEQENKITRESGRGAVSAPDEQGNEETSEQGRGERQFAQGHRVTRSPDQEWPPGHPVTLSPGHRIERRAITAGIVAALFVALAGNLAQPFWMLPGTANPADPAPATGAGWLPGSYAAQQAAKGRAEWAYWDATRTIAYAVGDSTISEFPFFTFLYGDLHAHMMALPLALAALALMLALYRVEHRGFRNNRFIQAGVLAILALVIGALRATNTWDYPSYLGLSILTLGLGAWLRYRRGAPGVHVLIRFALLSVGLVALSGALFSPFTRAFATDYAGFTIWFGPRTPIAEFLKINGPWLFILIGAGLLLYRRAGRMSTLPLALITMALLVLILVMLLFGMDALLLQVLLLAGSMLLLADLAMRMPEAQEEPGWEDEPEEAQSPGLGRLFSQYTVNSLNSGPYRLESSPLSLLLLLWGLAALGVALLPEVLVAKGDSARMNSVFKFGMQSWVLFAIVSGVALSWMWQVVRRAHPVPAWAWRVIVVLLVAGMLVYPLTATPARLADRFDTRIGPTLDGTAYMRSGSWAENNVVFSLAEDADALDWMRRTIEGTPIVLEAHNPGRPYSWAGRVSVYTGLPTLLGWPWHETQQRSVANAGPVLASRQQIIAEIYNDPGRAEALRLLQLYGVEYVYVGGMERALYDPAGLAKFEALAADGTISQVYAQGNTRIYQIPAEEHPPAVLTTTLPVKAPSQPNPPSMLDGRVGDLGGTFLPGTLGTGGTASEIAAVIAWLLAWYLILALGLPLAAIVFGSIQRNVLAANAPIIPLHSWSDGGYAWARLIGLLLLGYAVWLPVSAGLWHNDWPGLLAGALLVLFLNLGLLAWLGRNNQAANGGQHSAFGAGLRLLGTHLWAYRRRILLVEILFITAFAFMLVLRMLNPDLWQPYWGGEKPFEFGLLNAVLRSPVMPPYSPFFSDGVINYYYYGLFLVSLPVKATGIAPAVGFNLIIATLFGLTVAGVFGVASRISGRKTVGLIAVAFVALLGNPAAAFPANWSRGIGPVLAALASGLDGFGDRLDAWFVGPSRIIPNTINEFPYWGFLFADLHPHLIALPITVLMIGLVYEVFVREQRTTQRVPGREQKFPDNPSPVLLEQKNKRTSEQGDLSQPLTQSPNQERSQGYLVTLSRYGLIALALGSLAITNSWDFPTYTLLLGGALVGGAWRMRGSGWQRLWRMFLAALATGVVAGAAIVLYLPFFLNYKAPVGGIGFVTTPTGLGDYLLIYGLYLAVLVPLTFGAARRLVRVYGRAQHERAQPEGIGIVAGAPESSITLMPLTLLTLLAVLVGTAVIVAIIPPLLVALSAALQLTLPTSLIALAEIAQSLLGTRIWLIALLLVGAAVLLSQRLASTTWFTLWLTVVGWAVSLGFELVFIKDHLAGGDWYRMNTVFKFGMQVWVLLALAAALMLPRVARSLRRAGIAAELTGGVVFVLLLATTLVFPLAGTPSRVAYRFPVTPGPTLDGLAFMEQATYNVFPEYLGFPSGSAPPEEIPLRYDLEAIRWLNEHIAGTPVVLQSSAEFYRLYGVRVAANTGLPTVVSPLHENEQRDPALVGARDRDVQELYQTLDTEEALRLLALYRVGYVYVGPIERLLYGEPGAAKFEMMAQADLLGEPVLDEVYRNERVTIYKVRDTVYTRSSLAPVERIPAALPGASDAALAALERMVAANPSASEPAWNLAQRYAERGRFEDAVRVLRPFAQARPRDVLLQHTYGDMLARSGRYDEAEAAYRAAIAAEPTASNYTKLGAELLAWGRQTDGEEVLAEAIATDPALADPHFYLAQLYEEQGQKERAIQFYNRYLELSQVGDLLRPAASAALERLGQ